MNLWKEPVTYGAEVGGASHELLFVCIVLATAFFSVSFSLSWRLMEKYWPRFRKMSDSTKADNCSRVNSTIHSIVVTPALIHGLLTMKWGSGYEAVEDPWRLQLPLTVSVAYFLQDIYVMARYKTPLWYVFILHHVMATIPYVSYFFTKCNTGIFILCCYMLVELTNVSYNLQQWLEDCGETSSNLYFFCMYFTVVGWVTFRMVVPTWCLYVIHTYVFPSVTDEVYWALMPAAACGYFVNAFCYTAFFTVILKNALMRRTQAVPQSNGEGKSIQDDAIKTTRNNNLNGSRHNGLKKA